MRRTKIRTAPLLAVLLTGLIAVPWATADSSAATTSDDNPRVVMLGVPGLTWDDVTPEATPTLSSMVAGGAPVAALSMFATINSCDADGWLTVATGLPTTARVDDRCIPTAPVASDGGAQMSHWPEVRAVQERSAFHPQLGRLTADLSAQDTCVTAVGPGGAATAADDAGTVQAYADDLSELLAMDSCPVTVVDAGLDGSTKPERIDQVVAAVSDALPRDATALIFSVPDERDPARAMGIALEYRQGAQHSTPTYLISSTTRWPGVVSLIDVAPTVLALLGLNESSSWVGAPWTSAEAPVDAASLPDRLALIGDRDNSLRSVTWFFLGSVVLISLLVWIVREVATRSPGSVATLVERVTRSTRVATWLVAFPLASFLVGAIPWWHSSRPVLALYASALILTALLGELLRLVANRWGVLTAATVSALGLTVVIIGDVATGEMLTRGSPLGPSPLSGGRFYGFSNATSASLAGAAVGGAVVGAATLLGRYGRRPVLAVFGAFSATVVLVIALPTMGADVGGALTLLPTFAVTGAYLFRIRVTLWRLVVVVVVCVLVPLAIAVVDYIRPAEQRTHLGRFVDLAVSGQAWDLISRKAGYATSSLMSLMSLVTVVTLAVIAFQLLKLLRHKPLTGSWAVMADNRAVGAAVLGSWIAMVTGSAVNDYGIRMATIGLILLVPLLLLTLRPADGRWRPVADRQLTGASDGQEGVVPVRSGDTVQQ